MKKFRESDNLGKVSETEPRPTRIPSSDARKVSALLGVSESLDDGGNNPKVFCGTFSIIFLCRVHLHI